MSLLRQHVINIYLGLGNFRFIRNDAVNFDNYIPQLSYGLINFDNIGNSFLITIITLSGSTWSSFMFQVRDAYSSVAVVFFASLIFLGTYFVFQLLILVLKQKYHLVCERHKHYANVLKDDNQIISIEKGPAKLCQQVNPSSCWMYSLLCEKLEPLHNFFVLISHSLIHERVVSGLVMFNTLILSLDHYPMDPMFSNWVDLINFLLTLMFAVDIVIELLGKGVVEFFGDNFNRIDLVIVLLSLFELGTTSLPVFLTGKLPVS